MSSYGLAGTDPFVTWSKPATEILADFLANYWSSSETGASLNTVNYPASEVAWNQWYNNQKDVSIKFYDAVSVIKSQGSIVLGGAIQEEDKIIQIHIFARSFEDDSQDSAETMLFQIEEHFKKVIMQHWPELQDKGILKLYVRSVADRPFIEKEESFNSIIRRRIMTVVMRVWRVNQ